MTQIDPTRYATTQSPAGLEALSVNLLYEILEGQGVIESLSPEQVRALIPIARGDSIDKVAKAVGRAEKTIDRWLKQEIFKKAITATVVAIYTYGLRTCALASLEAIALLRKAVTDDTAKLNDRIRAATIILDMGDRWHHFHLESRITDLERRLAERAGELPPESDDGLDDEEEDDAIDE